MLVIAALVIGSAIPYKKLIEVVPGETATGPEFSLDVELFEREFRKNTIRRFMNDQIRICLSSCHLEDDWQVPDSAVLQTASAKLRLQP